VSYIVLVLDETVIS